MEPPENNTDSCLFVFHLPSHRLRQPQRLRWSPVGGAGEGALGGEGSRHGGPPQAPSAPTAWPPRVSRPRRVVRPPGLKTYCPADAGADRAGSFPARGRLSPPAEGECASPSPAGLPPHGRSLWAVRALVRKEPRPGVLLPVPLSRGHRLSNNVWLQSRFSCATCVLQRVPTSVAVRDTRASLLYVRPRVT